MCLIFLLFLIFQTSTTLITILTYITELVMACYENWAVCLLCSGNVLDEFSSNKGVLFRANKKIGTNILLLIIISRYQLILHLSFVIIALYANDNITPQLQIIKPTSNFLKCRFVQFTSARRKNEFNIFVKYLL